MQWVQTEASCRELCTLSHFFETFEELIVYTKSVASKRSIDITTITSSVLNKVRQQLFLDRPDASPKRVVKPVHQPPLTSEVANAEEQPEPHAPLGSRRTGTRKRSHDGELREDSCSPVESNHDEYSAADGETASRTVPKRSHRPYEEGDSVRHQLYATFGHLYTSRKPHNQGTWAMALKDKMDEAIESASSDEHSQLVLRMIIVQFGKMLDQMCNREPQEDSSSKAEQITQMQAQLGQLPSFTFRGDGRLIHQMSTAKTRSALSRTIIEDTDDSDVESSEPVQSPPGGATEITSITEVTGKSQEDEAEEAVQDTQNAVLINRALRMEKSKSS